MSNNNVLNAQMIGLTTSAILSGYVGNFSQAPISALLSSPVSPKEKTRIWSQLYYTGARTAPTIAAFSASSFVYLALKVSSISTKQTRIYGLAAFSTLAIVPYTLIGMRDVNGRLFARVEGEREVEEAEVHALLREWRWWNAGRALLPLVGCGLGWWAMISDGRIGALGAILS